MKKVLWVSRHEMTAEQRADLDRVMGGAELLPWKETVTDVAQLLPLLGAGGCRGGGAAARAAGKAAHAGGQQAGAARGEREKGHGLHSHTAGWAARAGVRLRPRRLGAAAAHGCAHPAAVSRPTIVKTHRTKIRAVRFL